MFSSPLATLLALAISLPISTSLAAYLDIISPALNDHWYAGEKYKVAWDINNPPGQTYVTKGAIYVVDGDTIQHDHELASNVNIADGSVWVEAPLIHTKPYRLALIADSIKYSPVFAIIGIPE